MIYKWKGGAQVKIDPQVAGEEMERIRVRNNGRLSSREVLESSRPTGSVFHELFEWDDAVAAEAHRVEQARYLIRSIEIAIENPESKIVQVRAFVSVRRDEDQSYTSTVHALSDEDLRVQVLAQAWKELEAWRHRHAELLELAKVFAVIDQARPAT